MPLSDRRRCPPDKPLVSTPADVISTGLGADVTIECTFDANPPVQVTWLHNGTMIRYEERANVALQHDERAATAGADDRWTLRITDVRPLDLGTYLCEGINQLGPSYREIQLTGRWAGEGRGGDVVSRGGCSLKIGSVAVNEGAFY